MEAIYLDHSATTPTRPEVVDAMARCLAEGHANPASQHQPGQRARRRLENARELIAEILGANLSDLQPDRLIFTSSGTEANNLAVLGIAQAQNAPPGQIALTAVENVPPAQNALTAVENAPGQIVISAIEHASVIEPAEWLMEQGWRLDTLGVDAAGLIHTDRLAGLLSAETRLVSATMGNHETGVLEPIAEIAAICNRFGVSLHSDAVAVAGKLPIDFRRLGLAAMSVAAHKFQGPVGIAALLLRHGVAVQPILFGGHQQHGLRPGTEPMALAVGMAAALELWHAEQDAELRRLTALRGRLEAGLLAGCPDAVIHSRSAPRLPHLTNVAFPGLDGQVLLLALDMAGVACSVGSACSSGSSEISPTLRAMQLPNGLAASSIRLSLGATTTEAEIDEAVRRIVDVCRQLRGEGR